VLRFVPDPWNKIGSELNVKCLARNLFTHVSPSREQNSVVEGRAKSLQAGVNIAL